MQLRLATKLTVAEYIRREAWKDSALEQCPWHPGGACGFASHGGYQRQGPAGLRIRRWYCPKAHQTVSLLPDFAAASLTGTLAGVEGAVAAFERERIRGATAGEAAQLLRPDIEQQGALRWIQRRRRWVGAALVLLVGCAPDLMARRELTLLQTQSALQSVEALVRIREIAGPQLSYAAAPVGFARGRVMGNRQAVARQHGAGPDPPSSPRVQ